MRQRQVHRHTQLRAVLDRGELSSRLGPGIRRAAGPGGQGLFRARVEIPARGVYNVSSNSIMLGEVTSLPAQATVRAVAHIP